MTARQLIFDEPCTDHGQVGLKGWGAYGTGYALTEVGRKRVRLHRLVFETFHGYRPEVVMHDCDNPRCINIKHLSPGTFDLNNKDRARKGRSTQHLHAKRRLTDEQVRDIRDTFVKGAPKGSECGVMALARKYGVDPNVIYQITSGRTYKDVA